MEIYCNIMHIFKEKLFKFKTIRLILFTQQSSTEIVMFIFYYYDLFYYYYYILLLSNNAAFFLNPHLYNYMHS